MRRLPACARLAAGVILATGLAAPAPARAEPPPAEPSVAPFATGADQLPEGLPGVPWIHIETDDARVELGRVAGGRRSRGLGRRTTYVCRAPCDRRVDGRVGELVFQVPGYGQSAPFEVSTLAGDVAFRVHPGNDVGRFLGIFGLTPLGAALLGGGVALAAGSSGRDLRPAGAGLIAGGAALAGLGIALFVLLDTTFERIAPPPRGRLAGADAGR